MTYKGKIYKIQFSFEDISSAKARPALAISEPDEHGDIEFLFITTKQLITSSKTIELTDDAFKTNSLPFNSVLHLEKSYFFPKNMLIKELATVKEQFLEKILRERAILSAIKHYEVMHKEIVHFDKGNKIPYAGRVFDKDEITNLVDASLDFWLTNGRYSDEFEEKFARFLGVKYCSLCNSGSSANLLAFMALTSYKLGERRIKRGDEVITVAAGFPTTVAPIIQYGAIPIFVDISIPTYNIDCSQLESALSEKTKAVMIAHTLGNPFNVKAVKEFCTKHNLWLIEDNCDALGSQYLYDDKWYYTGTFGDLATSSFYPPHHITMGEGGAVYTNNQQLHRIVNSLRDWGRDCWCPSGKDNTCQRRFQWQLGDLPFGYDHKYIYSHFGYNLKVTDMQAAIGCAQLKKLPSFIEARKKNWKLLREGLSELEDILILPEPTLNSNPSWFGFMLTVRDNAGFTRDEIVQYLESNGIQTRMLFAGNLLRHPCFDEMRREGKDYRVIGDLKNTEKVMKDSFWIGVYPGMTEEKVVFMINSIKRFLNNINTK